MSAQFSKEEALYGLIDKSPVSDHPLHQGDTAEKDKATSQDFQSKGPAIPQSMDDMPPKASTEELKARSEELNK